MRYVCTMRALRPAQMCAEGAVRSVACAQCLLMGEKGISPTPFVVHSSACARDATCNAQRRRSRQRRQRWNKERTAANPKPIQTSKTTTVETQNTQSPRRRRHHMNVCCMYVVCAVRRLMRLYNRNGFARHTFQRYNNTDYV